MTPVELTAAQLGGGLCYCGHPWWMHYSNGEYRVDGVRVRLGGCMALLTEKGQPLTLADEFSRYICQCGLLHP